MASEQSLMDQKTITFGTTKETIYKLFALRPAINKMPFTYLNVHVLVQFKSLKNCWLARIPFYINVPTLIQYVCV